jgi:hypothetical protein
MTKSELCDLKNSLNVPTGWDVFDKNRLHWGLCENLNFATFLAMIVRMYVCMYVCLCVQTRLPALASEDGSTPEGRTKALRVALKPQSQLR